MPSWIGALLFVLGCGAGGGLVYYWIKVRPEILYQLEIDRCGPTEICPTCGRRYLEGTLYHRCRPPKGSRIKIDA